MRPDKKINYNFSFTGEVKSTSVLNDDSIEKDHFSFVQKNKVIKWNLNFFTIYIKGYIFNVNVPIHVIINGALNRLVYIGNQKDIFSQRVINATFNRAMRMGVDLPHKLKENNKLNG